MLLSSVSTKFLSGSATAFRRSFHASTTCFEKLNVEGLAKKVDLDGQNVLVRVDLNVPLAKVCIVVMCVILIMVCLELNIAVYLFRANHELLRCRKGIIQKRKK